MLLLVLLGLLGISSGLGMAKTTLLERGAEGWRDDYDGAMDEGWRATDFNEITLEGGEIQIVDVMNPEEDFELPEPSEVHFN